MNIEKNTCPITLEEEILRIECKQSLKTRVFRGYYLERCYEESIGEYRDIVVLQKSEHELRKVLLDVKDKLSFFYSNVKKCKMWIGISNDKCSQLNDDTLCVRIRTNINDLAFGQYWFFIKTIRFLNDEIQIKLKPIRPVEPELQRPYRRPMILSKREDNADMMVQKFLKEDISGLEINLCENQTKEINLSDFIELFKTWMANIKQTTYDFLAQDVNRQNIKELFRFLGLLIVSLITFGIVGIKHLGIFTLRLIFETSRFTRASTPIVFKIMDTIGKLIGGFYILLAMIWTDIFDKRRTTYQLPSSEHRRQPKMIKYDPRYSFNKKT